MEKKKVDINEVRSKYGTTVATTNKVGNSGTGVNRSTSDTSRTRKKVDINEVRSKYGTTVAPRTTVSTSRNHTSAGNVAPGRVGLDSTVLINNGTAKQQSNKAAASYIDSNAELEPLIAEGGEAFAFVKADIENNGNLDKATKKYLLNYYQGMADKTAKSRPTRASDTESRYKAAWNEVKTGTNSARQAAVPTTANASKQPAVPDTANADRRAELKANRQKAYDELGATENYLEQNKYDFYKERLDRLEAAGQDAQMQNEIRGLYNGGYINANTAAALALHYGFDENGSKIDRGTRDIADKIVDLESGADNNTLTQIFAGFGGGTMDTSALALQNVGYNNEAEQLKRQLRNMGYTDAQINSLINSRRDAVSAVETLSNQAYVNELSAQHPVLASTYSFLTKPIGDVMAAGDFALNAASGNYNPNSSAQQMRIADSQIRQSVKEQNIGRFGTADIPIIGERDKFGLIYDTIMSSADSVYAGMLSPNLGLGDFAGGALATKAADGVGKKILKYAGREGIKLADNLAGGALISLGALTDTAAEMAGEGYTTEQIVSTSIAAAVFEGMFEAWSLGNLEALDSEKIIVNGLKDYVKSMAMEAGVNASEEALTEAANILFDRFANGQQSEWARKIEQYTTIYMAQGLSYDEAASEAKKRAAKEYGSQVVEAGFGGALQGILMGSSKVAKDTAAKGALTAAEKAFSSKPVQDFVSDVDYGATMDRYATEEAIDAARATGDSAVEKAAKKVAKAEAKKGASARQKGKLARMTDSAIESRTAGTYFSGMTSTSEINEAYREAIDSGEKSFDRDGRTYSLREIGDQWETLSEYFGGIESRAQAAKATTAEGRVVEATTDGGEGTFAGRFVSEGGKLKLKVGDNVTDVSTYSYANKLQRDLYNLAAKSAPNATIANNIVRNYDGRSTSVRDYVLAYNEALVLSRSMNADNVYQVLDERSLIRGKIRGDILSDEALEQAIRDGWTTREYSAGFKTLWHSKPSSTERFEAAVIDRYAKKHNLSVVSIDNWADYAKNGVQVGDTNLIILDRNAEGSLFRAAGHEMEHFTEVNAPKAAAALEKVVIGALEAQGSVVSELEADYGSRGYSQNQWRSELIADAMFDVFNEKTVRELIKEMGTDNAKKFEMQLATVVSDLREAVKLLSSQNKTLSELYKLTDQIDKMDEIRKLFHAGVEEASKNWAAGMEAGMAEIADGGFFDGARFSYRGEKSQGADLTALGQAKQMFESGESSENIRQATGWFKGYDGKWRYEIDDSKMELTGELIKFVDGTELGKLIKHNELFAAYPQLKNVKVRVLDSADVNGSADPDENDIYINSRLLQNTDAEKKRNKIFQSDEYKDYSEKLAQLHKARELASKPLLDRFVEEASNGNAEAAAKARDEYKKAVSEYDKQIDQLTEAWSQSELGQQVAKLSEKSLQEGEQLSEDAKYTLIHEIQHFIQYYESFANGSNPEEWEGKIYDALSQKKKEAESKLLKYATPENNLKELIYQYDERISRINGDDSDALRRMASAYDAIAQKINDEDIEEAFFEYSNATEEFVTAFAGDNLRSKGMEYYRRTAGEVESRDVSSRLDYSAEQRKNTRPDIDRTDVVFADDNGISLFAIKPDTDIENKNIANGNKVLDSMIEQAKTVENPETLIYKNAMYRSDIGQIDFVWGKPGNGARFKKGYGISHIIAKHGESTAKKAIEVIAKGTDYTKQGNNSTDETHYRIRLNYDGYTVVLSKDADSNHWLLTAWDNKEETAEYATVEVRDSTGATAATPTLNRRSGVNTTVSTDSIANSDKNVKQFSLRDSDGNTLSEQQAEYFKDSKVRDEDVERNINYSTKDADYMKAVESGDMETVQRMVDEAAKAAGYSERLYHQTDNDFTIFDINHPGAGSRDNETPYGVFMKKNNRNIGLKGSKQMPLFAKITNPLNAKSREDLVYKLRKISVEYSEIKDKLSILDNEYQEKFDNAKKAWRDYLTEYRKDHPNENRREIYNDKTFNELFDAEDKIVDEWTAEATKLDKQAKEIITKALKTNGYDGVIISHDVGSFGRETDAYIALNSSQVKSAEPITYDDNGEVIPLSKRFDSGNEDIRFSLKVEHTDGSEDIIRNPAEVSDDDVIKYLELARKQKINSKSYIPLGRYTPSVIVNSLNNSEVDIRPLPLVIQAGKAYKSMRKNPTKNEGKYNKGHDYKPEEIIEVLDAMNSPNNIILQANGRVAVFVNSNIRQSESLTVIEFDTDIGDSLIDDDGITEFNTVVTIFDPDTIIDGEEYDYYQQLIDEGGQEIEIVEELDESDSIRKILPLSATSPSTAINPTTSPSQSQEENSESRKLTPTEQLTLENEQLRSANAALQQEFKLTQGHHVSEKALGLMAGRLLKNTGSTMQKTELQSRLRALFDYIGNTSELVWEDVQAATYSLAKDLIESSSTIDEEWETEAQPVRDFIKGTRIYISPETKAEIEFITGSYDRWRRSFMGNITFTTTDDSAISLDDWWQAAVDEFPGIFNAQAFPAEQPDALTDIMAMIKPQYHNSYEAYGAVEEQTSVLAEEIYDAYFDLPEVKTYADKMTQKLNLEKGRAATLREEHRQAITDLRSQLRNQYAERLKAVREEHRGKEQKARTAYNERLERQRAKYEGRARQLREQKADTESRAKMRTQIGRKVKKLNKLLLNPTDKAHIPEEFKGNVLAFLEVFANDTSVFNKQKLVNLASSYAEIGRTVANSDGSIERSELEALYDESIRSVISHLSKVIGGRRLSQLNAEETRFVANVVDNIYAMINRANKNFSDKIAGTLSENYDAIKSEVSSEESGHKQFKATRFRGLAYTLLDPIHFFDSIGSKTLSQYWQACLDANYAAARKTKEARAFFDELSQYNPKKWRNHKVIWLDMELTVPEAMSIYSLWQRPQARQHLLGGGITFAKDTGKSFRVGSKEGVVYQPNYNEYVELFAKLTDEQKKCADAMIEYMSNTVSGWANDTSMILFGYRKFNEETYFPITSSEYFLTSAPGDQNAKIRLKNLGSTQATITNANNTVKIDNVFDVVGTHVAQMINWSSYTPAFEDLQRIFNAKDSNLDGTSFKQMMSYYFGKNVNTYISTLIDDLNGGAVSASPKTYDWLISRAKKLAVTANISVVLKQPGAIGRTLPWLNPVDYRGLPIKNFGKAWAELQEYCPVAILKEMGGIDTNTGRTSKEYMLDGLTDTKLQAVMGTVDDVASWGAENADKMTWCHIWNACKNNARRKNKGMSDTQIKQEAAKLFNEIIEHSQVYDSVLTRSQLMRSKNSAAKLITSFMAEPTKTFDELFVNWAKLIGRKDKAGRKFIVTALGAVAANFFTALGGALAGAARDDDDYATFLEKFIGNFMGNFVKDPLTLVPYSSDILSIFEGFDPSRLDLTLIGDTADVAKYVYQLIKKENKELKWDEAVKVFSAIPGWAGLPTKAVAREVFALKNVGESIYRYYKETDNGKHSTPEGIKSAIANEFILFGKPIFGKADSDILYNAIISGDRTESDRLNAYAESQDKTTDSKVKTGLIDNDDRIEEAAKALINGDVSTWDRLIDDIVADGFDENLVTSAINTVKNKLAPKEDEGGGGTADKSRYTAEILGMALSSGDNSMLDTIYSDYETRDGEEKAQKKIQTAVTKAYKNGDISWSTAESIYRDYGYDDANDLYWKHKELDANLEEDEYFSKYTDFYAAIDSGKNIGGTMLELQAHGSTNTSIMSQLTKHYKPILIEMRKTNPAKAKAIQKKLEGIYKTLGAKNPARDIEDWFKPKK